MFKTSRGIAPVVVVLIVALGLVGGVAAGYEFREPIKKALLGKDTSDEIKEAVEASKVGQDKFELEGVVSSVDVPSTIITVKIKSSTESVKTLRNTDAPITVLSTAKILFGDKEDLKIGDIPINSQVHAAGTVADGKLTATKIIVQKEDAGEVTGKELKRFSVQGTVKSIDTTNNSIVVTVSSASKKAKSFKGKDLTILIAASTVFEKGDSEIVLADVKVGDKVLVTGTVTTDVYTAAQVIIKVKTAESSSETKKNSGND